jgi:hypothetical protein
MTDDDDFEKIKKIFERLEAAGLIVRNGEMRPGREGEFEPVFVIAPQYENDREAWEKVLALLHETAGNG